MKQITEFVHVKVESTEDEALQIMTGSSILPIIKLNERYRETIEFYKSQGYEIVSQEIEKHSFNAEKKYEVEDDE